MSPPDEAIPILFTRERVIESLQFVRLIGSKPLPIKTDAIYDTLADILNRLAYFRNTDVDPEEGRFHSIYQAIETLRNLLPVTRALYEVNLRSMEVIAETYPEITSSGLGAFTVNEMRRHLAAINSLSAAIEEANACDLPIGGLYFNEPRLKGDTELILRLDEAVKSCLPGCGVGERHRFIARVVQTITGKDLSPEQIRDRIRKPRGQ